MFVSFLCTRREVANGFSPKIIASRPKNYRKTTSRRSVRAPVLGKQEPTPSARSRYTTSVPGLGKTTSAPAQAAEKIIVSNLPIDVNESQIKVCVLLLINVVSRTHSFSSLGIIPFHHWTPQRGYPAL